MAKFNPYSCQMWLLALPVLVFVIGMIAVAVLIFSA